MLLFGGLILLYLLENGISKYHEQYKQQNLNALNDNYTFPFSIIMPIYNTEKYIADAINSVITQTLSFERYIQLILVNDGSTDNSESICLMYANKYPNNILYIKKENGGLSSARNAGLPYVKGRYVNFLDPDDLWEKTALDSVFKFFSLYSNIVDVVAGRVKFFEARNDYHPLDYKFQKTRVIDLTTEYQCVQLSVATAFIKADIICRRQFDINQVGVEDAILINTILLDNPRYGVVREALYMYRKRLDGSSIIQNTHHLHDYYFKFPYSFLYHLLNISTEKYGTPPLYIQYVVMYDLQWRIKQRSPSLFDEHSYRSYLAIIHDLLTKINDEVILTQRNIDTRLKLFCLSEKYGYDIRYNLTYTNGKIIYNNYVILNLHKARPLVSWVFFEIVNSTLILEGRDSVLLPHNSYSYSIRTGNTTYLPSYINYRRFSYSTLFGVTQEGRIVRFEIPLRYPLKTALRLQLLFTYQSHTHEIAFLMGTFAHLPPVLHSYYVGEKWIVTSQETSLVIQPYSRLIHFLKEKKYCKCLIKMGKGEVVLYRLCFWITSLFKRKESWIICDRPNQADDNGEALFRFLHTIPGKMFHAYFILRSSSPDFQRIRKYGTILLFDSFKVKLLSLLADNIISSNSGLWTDNPFGFNQRYFMDILHYHFVFLQHGIIYNDVSPALHRFNRNFKLFITSSKYEYDSLLDPKYGYSTDVIKLTGLARHDSLLELQKRECVEKMILVIPTWRSSIPHSRLPVTFESVYSESFKTTEYYRYFNKLINDNTLVDAMKEFGYRGIFSLHPSLKAQWVDFHPNDVFIINNGSYNYQSLFVKASLMITDYSSVFFDFAYLGKPIIYSQFDVNEFRKTQYAAGYFTIEQNGFGPICTTIEDTVVAIINEMKHNCTVDTIYQKRMENFYAFRDGNNCKRIYEAIKSLSHGRLQSFLPDPIYCALLLIIIAWNCCKCGKKKKLSQRYWKLSSRLSQYFRYKLE